MIGAQTQLEITVYNEGQQVKDDSVTVSEIVHDGKPTVAGATAGTRDTAPPEVAALIGMF